MTDSNTPEHGPNTGTPRWVVVFVALVVLLVLLVVVMLAGGHGPGVHTP